MTIQGNQFCVRAAFDDFAVLQHKDAIGQAYGAETVADENGGFAGGKLAELGKDFIFGLRVKLTGRLIQDEDTCISHEGTRKRYFLPLAAAQLRSGVPPATQQGIVAIG